MANVLDAKTLKKVFLAGTKRLDTKQAWINELNVFPVPDGDTGTNMTLTLMNAVKELNALSDENSMEEVSRRMSAEHFAGSWKFSDSVPACQRVFKRESKKDELDKQGACNCF